MEPSSTIRVLIVDDQAMIRQGLAYMISAQSDLNVVGQAADGDEAVMEAAERRPDVILMDIRMPKQNGIAATARIVASGSPAKIVLLTTFDDEQNLFDGIRAGAVGYLLKDADVHELLDAIRRAARGEAVYRTASAARALARAVSHQSPQEVKEVETRGVPLGPGVQPKKSVTASEGLAEPLTEREIEVLQQMAYGKRNMEIATTLSVSEGTVKTHVHRILQKLGVEDRTQAVVFALRDGLVN
ncbi:MAG: response regulator transcription factor [Alicyclobacillaceae bacterium]|nr:response regulator transcription factor [Alicyclobacillaceae bacterium]